MSLADEQSKLFGRVSEQQRLKAMLRQAVKRGGVAAALVGEPGSGKSALLKQARRDAGHARVLATRGLDVEAAIPYAGLTSVLRPLGSCLDEFPAALAEPLRSLLVLGEPVSDASLGPAVLRLLERAAEDGPLCVFVDDAHWFDPLSTEALSYAARRVQRRGVLMLFAFRSGAPTLLTRTGLEAIVLGGIDLASARQLLAERAGFDIPSDVATSLWQQTGGNPRALCELCGLLRRDQLLGTAPLPNPLPAGPGSLAAFGRQLDKLPQRSRFALVLAATAETGPAGGDRPSRFGELDHAFSALNIRLEDLEPAVAAGLIRLHQQLPTFHNPLVRSVIYTAASQKERRTAQEELAARVPARQAEAASASLGAHEALGCLTGQERRVALLVATGATNNEVATHLFVSPKTIEFHLSHIYRKLGMRSRSQLAAYVAAGGSTPPTVAEPAG